MSIKRGLSLVAAGLMCAGTMAASSGAAGAATAGTAPSVPQPGGPVVRAPGYTTSDSSSAPTISLNWSGYATLSSKRFDYVHATFVQPAVTCPGIKYQWTSNWVGLDGYNNQTVEQDGTDARCGGPDGTTPQYEAWYEMFPGPSANVFPVHAGDIINISVTYDGGKFVMAETDETTGKSSSVAAKCSSCRRDSAEWIIERPALCNKSETKCFLTELADFRGTRMSAGTAALDGGPVKHLSGFSNIPIFMVDPIHRGVISLDTVGPVSGPSFTATWDRHGTTTPITLGPRA